MRQVTDWLAALGLKQYAERFVENDIDLAVLLALTDQDLEKIGVLSLGHRRKILMAIAELTGGPAPEPVASPYWRAWGTMNQGCMLAQIGKTGDAIKTITAGIAAFRSTGASLSLPLYLSNLAKGHADFGQFDEASRRIAEAMTAMETSRQNLWEAEVHRIAGEIALMLPERDAAKAETYFERALAVARQQQAKSWGLRAAMSMARLWRHQGKRDEARDLLARVYGWFTEGFDTLDLKQAKALLDELAR
jgi:predicted ATPase